jgi:hypothetical protein
VSEEKKGGRVRKTHAITLASYTMRVRRKRSDDYGILGEFSDEETMLDFLYDFFIALQKSDVPDEATMSLQRARKITRDERSVWGVVESGDYGYSADLVDVNTLSHSYQRRTADAELYPFFFLINAPSSSDRAILIFQRHGNRSMYTELLRRLRTAFEDKHPDHLLDFRRHVPKAIVDSLLHGQVKSIELTSYHLADDLADRVKYQGNRTEVGEVQITLKAKRKRFLKRPQWLDKLMKDRGNLLEIADEVSELGDRVRVTVSYNGKNRVVDFHDMKSIAPYLDVTSDIRLGRDGHPTPESIEAVTRSHLSDLLVEMG